MYIYQWAASLFPFKDASWQTSLGREAEVVGPSLTTGLQRNICDFPPAFLQHFGPEEVRWWRTAVLFRAVGGGICTKHSLEDTLPTLIFRAWYSQLQNVLSSGSV